MKKHKKNNKPFNAVLAVLVVLMAAGLGFMVYRVQHEADNEKIENAGTSANADHSFQYITYQGKNYPVLRNMTSILLIGTDNFVDDGKQFTTDMYYNRNLADFLVCLVIDHDAKTVTPLQFNRDTMCDVPWLGINGVVGGYNFEHLTFAHMYGSGKDDSCINTVNTVRKLIYNAPIDHYFAFTMDAVPLMNDLVGGVTITLDEDFPTLGEEYVAGAQITLRGSAALRYLRYRDINMGGSNWYRMGRHRTYLMAFTDAARAALQENQDLAIDAFKLIEPFLVTDLTVNDISLLVDNLCTYEIKEAVTPSGKIVAGEKYYEFYVDEESLWNCVKTAFCRNT